MCPTCGSKKITSQAPVTKNSDYKIINPDSKAILTKINPSSSNNVNLGKNLNFYTTSLGKRFFAFIIDTIIVSILTSLPILFAYLINIPFKKESINPLSTIAILASFVAPYAYYTVMHAAPYSATFGKRWMGIKSCKCFR
jgi:hypothetical protein